MCRKRMNKYQFFRLLISISLQNEMTLIVSEKKKNQISFTSRYMSVRPSVFLPARSLVCMRFTDICINKLLIARHPSHPITTNELHSKEIDHQFCTIYFRFRYFIVQIGPLTKPPHDQRMC